MITQTLAEKVGVDFTEIERKAREAQEIDRQSNDAQTNGKVEGEVEGGSREAGEQESMAQTLFRQRQASEHEQERLQHAVNVLLRLALRSGWIQGAEALHLEKILDGSDQHTESAETTQTSKEQTSSPILSRVALLQQQR